MGEIINKVKGRIKQAVGDLTGDKQLRREGVRDERMGQTQGIVEAARHTVKDAAKGVKETAKEASQSLKDSE